MAEAIAVEWDAQENIINPNTMPVTKTANAAIDKVMVQHAEVAEMLAAYGDSDLLCYRADAPEALVERQAAIWDPMLEWAHGTLGARLLTRTGVMHRPQTPEALGAAESTHPCFECFRVGRFSRSCQPVWIAGF